MFVAGSFPDASDLVRTLHTFVCSIMLYALYQVYTNCELNAISTGKLAATMTFVIYFRENSQKLPIHDCEGAL